MTKTKETRYYKSYEDDFVQTPDQNYKLPENYQWIKKGLRAKVSRFFTNFLGGIFGRFYGKFFLHIKIVRNINLKMFKNTGIVVYANHTQPVGDAFNPLIVCRPKKCYTVASPANLAMPFIGKLITNFILPVPQTTNEARQFLSTLKVRLDEHNCVVVYPEAHVWEYCSFIRPFPSTSFSYAVDNNVPAFCMTSTYQKRKRGKPKMTIYLDGPFYSDKNLPRKEQQKKLRDEVYNCMVKRAKCSDVNFIDYRSIKEKTNGQ